MEILNTNQVEHTYLKVCVYGRAGAGKTHLIQTASRPFGISAEGGFLSLQGTSIDYTEVRKVEDLREVWKYLQDLNQKGVTIFLTSHYMDEVLKFCSKVLIIKNGAEVVQGAPDYVVKESGKSDLEEAYLYFTGEDENEDDESVV